MGKDSQGELGGVTHRVTCTWWLLGLAVKLQWLGPVGPILVLTVRIQDFSSKFSGLDDRLLNLKGREPSWKASVITPFLKQK